MRTCAFLSMDNLDAFECYDHLLYEPLQDFGWQVQEVSWRDTDVNWDEFDVVIIRSPWDYQDDPEAFLEVLRTINRSSALLLNSLETVEWNIDKSYLKDVASKGAEIVPTLWRDNFNPKEFSAFFDELEAETIIIKPRVSANADDTFKIHRTECNKYVEKLASLFADRPFMVQPFMENIILEGEFSLFFFGDTYSHTILKKPGHGDFRVQEEHGGSLHKVEPDMTMLEQAKALVTQLTPTPLYSRIDYVRNGDTFALMELELIEPSLYFNMDEKSPKRFATVFDEWMRNYFSAPKPTK